jgi:hypothetical protein
MDGWMDGWMALVSVVVVAIVVVVVVVGVVAAVVVVVAAATIFLINSWVSHLLDRYCSSLMFNKSLLVVVRIFDS